MKKLKVLTSFTRLPIVDKASFCRNVLVKMANNILFGAPDVSLAEATAALDAFDAAILAAKDGAHTAISIRNDCEKVVDAKFILLAKYVDRIADGDETTILSSGFNESRQPSTPAKEELTVKDGDFPGSIFTKSWLIEVVDKKFFVCAEIINCHIVPPTENIFSKLFKEYSLRI